MHAALVQQFDAPPRYAEVPEPIPVGDHEEAVRVLATGLHPRVRSQARGAHYTSSGELPLIPGIDGVGRRDDGSLVYFALGDTTQGSMAERTVIDARRAVPLPSGADVVLIAAAMNPAMSSWVALTRRVVFARGQSVLIMGATGSAGQLAIQVARHLGAGDVTAAGRGAARLEALRALGADRTIDLAADPDAVADDLASKAAEVDVVLDYLWGPPAATALMPLLRGREDRSRRLSWIQIGAVAGRSIDLPSAALRQANLHILGSGQGSVGTSDLLATLPRLVDEIVKGSFAIDAVAMPLAEVQVAWGATASAGPTRRIVLVPGD